MWFQGLNTIDTQCFIGTGEPPIPMWWPEEAETGEGGGGGGHYPSPLAVV